MSEKMSKMFKHIVRPGPWTQDMKDYPDTIEDCKRRPGVYTFTHAGYMCIVKRHDLMFFWTGYVEIPEEHPDYDKDYDRVDVLVHGGCLTFGAGGFFGFDCAHFQDRQPVEFEEYLGTFKTYKDYAFVVQKTKDLADQFKSRA